MKGIVFNLLEDFLVEMAGYETYLQILADCPEIPDAPFLGPHTYPDAWLLHLAQAASVRVGAPLPEALRAFGIYCFPHLANKFPSFLQPFSHPKPFLLSLHDVIHVEVRKLMEGATPPNFGLEDPSPTQLRMDYHSSRGLCAFMEGLLQGAAAWFACPITTEQVTCTHTGAPHCRFLLTFATPWHAP